MFDFDTFEEKIQENLQSTDWKKRAAAIHEVAFLDLWNALDMLLPFLYDPNPNIRSAVAVDLEIIHDIRVVPHLIKFAQQETESEPLCAAYGTLRSYIVPAVGDFLLSEAPKQHEDRCIRQEIARQLRNYDTEQSVDVLVVLLDDEDVYVVQYAAESLLILNRERLRPIWDILQKKPTHPAHEYALIAKQYRTTPSR